MLASRDNTIIVPALKSDAGAAQGPISGTTLVGPRSFFTEVMDVGAFIELIAFLNVTSHSGTNPTLDVTLQCSPDKLEWINIGDAFTQVDTTDSLTLKKITANFGKYVRFRIDIGGTSSPTYVFSLYLIAKA